MSTAVAENAQKPLTLKDALAAAEFPHPALRGAEADMEVAIADQRLAATRNDMVVSVEAGWRRVRPDLAFPGGSVIDDDNIALVARKTLYDFGRTFNSERATKFESDSRRSRLVSARSERQIEIMTRFFEVLMADLQYSADNEFMSVAYVNFDHGRHRLRIGQISDVDLLDMERRYQDLLLKRNLSLQRQRITRSRLANAMNRPGNLPSDLTEPELDAKQHVLPALEELQAVMFAANPALVAQRELLDASRARIDAIRADRNPSIDLEIQAAEYTRKLTGRDDNRLALVLNWPLYQGEYVDARVARERALFQRQLAVVDRLAMELRQSLLETYLEIDLLQTTVRSAARQQTEFTDRALDKARVRYEMEFETTLGTSMAAAMEAKVRERSTEYQLTLALAKLGALLNRPVFEFPSVRR